MLLLFACPPCLFLMTANFVNFGAMLIRSFNDIDSGLVNSGVASGSTLSGVTEFGRGVHNKLEICALLLALRTDLSLACLFLPRCRR